MGTASTSVIAAHGMSSRNTPRMPVASRERTPSRSPRLTNRLSAGNSTVATATLNMPCGSM